MAFSGGNHAIQFQSRRHNSTTMPPYWYHNGGVVTPLLAFSLFIGYAPFSPSGGGLFCSLTVEKPHGCSSWSYACFSVGFVCCGLVARQVAD
jgi:hypothetical protein